MTALKPVELDPATISMTFGVNDSPLAGLDGTQVREVAFILVVCRFIKLNPIIKSLTAYPLSVYFIC